MLALQVAVVPPLLPVHVQPQGPVPVMAVAAPVVQKLIVGAVVNVLPLLYATGAVDRCWRYLAESGSDRVIGGNIGYAVATACH